MRTWLKFTKHSTPIPDARIGIPLLSDSLPTVIICEKKDSSQVFIFRTKLTRNSHFSPAPSIDLRGTIC
jgi:hypothetical protein